jgi:hypothetical protein
MSLAEDLSPIATNCTACGASVVIFDANRYTCWACTPDSYQAKVERVVTAEPKPAKKPRAPKVKPQGSLF